MGLISEGGCVEGLRFLANDRTPLADEDMPITDVMGCRNIIIAVGIVGDDMNTIVGDYVIQWRNKTDDPSGSWNTLSSSGEMKWGADTVLVNGNAVASGESKIIFDECKEPDDWVNGIEREGAVLIDEYSLVKKSYTEFQWAVDPSGADFSGGGDEYEFRLYDPEGAEELEVFEATAKFAQCATLSGVTKDKNGEVLVSMEVSIFSVESEGPPSTYKFIDSQMSDGVTGVYLFEVAGGVKHMVYSIKDDSPHVFDASDNVLEGEVT